MKIYIPFIDELIRDSNQNQTEINGRYVESRPLGWQGWMGVKERFFGALAILQGKAIAVRYMESQVDVEEARGRHKRING